MAKINFSLMLLNQISSQQDDGGGERIISPRKDTFNGLIPKKKLVKGVLYKVSPLVTDDYIWISFDFGKPSPRDEHIINTKTMTSKKNPRKIEEAELINQFFFLYSFKKKTLYLSKLDKINFIENYFLDEIDKKFEIKSKFIKIDDFISTIDEINSIKFTRIKNLFNWQNKDLVKNGIVDLTGIECPDELTIIAKYSKCDKLKNFIRKIATSRKKNELDELIIKGRDEEKFNFVFNVNSFIKKITINITKEKNGKFEEEIIRNKILEII
ncbi:MAG: hypothetical protein D3918_12350 [Candidatus Electrothrix sp. AX2]|nr:hypothetical protein [Candidatus Electrothrix gigas]